MQHERMIERVSWFLCRGCAARWQVPEWPDERTHTSCPGCGLRAPIMTIDDDQGVVGLVEQLQASLAELRGAVQAISKCKGGACDSEKSPL
jgi:hypothetical protein